MYCHHCERKQPDDAVFCCYCGRPLDIKQSQYDEAAAGDELPEATPQEEQRKGGAAPKLAWFIPIIGAVAITAALALYYNYELGINEKAEELHQQAQFEAIAGKYADAAYSLEQALELRPGHDAFQADAAIVAMAIKVEQALALTSKQLDEKDAEGASKNLLAVGDDLDGRSEELFSRLQSQLLGQQERLMALQLMQGLHALNSIEDLGYALTTLSGLGSVEAEQAREGLVNKIVSITDTSAQLLLQKKKFKDAINIVNKGLEYVKDSEQLLGLLEEAKQAKADYEYREQLRLEQAMQKAAAEDLKNQTAAVEVIRVETFIDAEDRFTVQGELLNAATRPIYRVTVEFTVYSQDGEALATGVAEASPEYAEIGERLYFYNDELVIMEENTTATIDNVTWYLD